MSTTLPLRPSIGRAASNCLSARPPRSLHPSPSSLTPLYHHPHHPSTQQRRHEATARRLTKKHRIPPAPAFANTTQPQDHIIYNPPSSAPNVYHTPLKFLPKSDRRRDLLLAQQHAAQAAAAAYKPSSPFSTASPAASALASLSAGAGAGSGAEPPPTPRLPPPIRVPYEKKYHLTPPQLEEMRKLRAHDPRKWTRVRLAEKFECSQFFVSLVCQAPQIKAERDAELENIKKRWGRQKRMAREDRVKRKESWGRDV
ncbi:hypothetical protein H2201_007969 [Coniosporium apollinis]|uniref:Uncharacterized protein n=1 Tax=Coniosporium apollinis TaxID=61459 RepID=A0ABQ9NLR3_9PEZI|nr:hypothetical protein H2201_007969 [Coniosporium apollinis]